jgi:hypothetical protein
MKLRALNAAGDQAFLTYLTKVRSGSPEAPPSGLLENPDTSVPIQRQIEIEHQTFGAKLDFAQHLVDRLAPLPLHILRNELGVWSWLALFYFDQLAPAGADGTRKLLANELYVPSTHYQRKYRHLVFGPFLAYKLHGPASRLMLTKALSVWSDLEEQLIGVQEIIQIPGALRAAELLYFDKQKQEPKRGVTNRKKGGTVRRLRDILFQFDVTFDIYSLTGEELVALLPKEFDRFKQQSTA